MGESFDGRDLFQTDSVYPESTQMLQKLYTYLFAHESRSNERPEDLDCFNVVHALFSLRNTNPILVHVKNMHPETDMQRSYVEYVTTACKTGDWAVCMLRLLTEMDYTDEEISVAFSGMYLYKSDMSELNAASVKLNLPKYFKQYDTLRAQDDDTDHGVPRVSDEEGSGIVEAHERSLEFGERELQDMLLDIVRRLKEGTHKHISKEYHASVVVEALFLGGQTSNYEHIVAPQTLGKKVEYRQMLFSQVMRELYKNGNYELPICKLLIFFGYSKPDIAEGVDLFLDEHGIDKKNIAMISKWDQAFSVLDFDDDLLLARHLYH